MPTARVLPKKFLGALLEMQEELRLVAMKCKQATLEIEARLPPQHQSVRALLQEVESTAYRLAYELSQLRIAGTCDECPSAPPTTMAQAHLLVLADELERQAELARRRALSQLKGDSDADAWDMEDGGAGVQPPRRLM
jgi:hypothetical protein